LPRIDVKLHFLHVLAILFVLTTLIMSAIGRWKPMPVPFRFQERNLVDVKPWKNRYYYYAIILMIVVLLIFMLFSPIGLSRAR
jgi:SSS family solute:Na+ symporter